MHVIRLRRPWHKSIKEDAMSVEVDVPELDVERGSPELREQQTFIYRRNFNLPSRLQESSRVYLRIDGWQGRLESAVVNGFPLEVGHARITADITNVLEPQNRITLRLTDLPRQAARLNGEVTLAIDDDSP